MNRKMTLLAGAISSVLSGAALADINDIIITEYVESAVDKYARNSAIEISNNGTEDFTFTSHALYYSSYNNKVLKPDGVTPVLDKVIIPAGKTIVVMADDATEDLKNAVSANGAKVIFSGSFNANNGGTAVGHSALNFKGSEAVWIGDVAAPAVIHDIIGLNDSSWGKAVTLRRTNDATTPDAEYVPLHWVSAGTDIYDDLGKMTLAEPPAPPTPPTEVTLAEVQGSGMFSPLIEKEHGSDLKEDKFYETEENYKLTARVSHVLTSANNGISKGFFLYDEDNNPATSNGLFVYSNKANADMVGQEITVTGKVREYFGQTQFALQSDGDWVVTDSNKITIAPADMKRIESDGASFAKTLERYEGMLVKLVEDMDDAKEGNQSMHVTRAFNFDFELLDKKQYRNNMVLAYERPNFHPNQDHVAGSFESLMQLSQNRDRTLFIDSAVAPKNGEIPYYPAFNSDPQKNYIRINDTVKNLEGVMTYSYDEYRLVPSNQLSTSDIVHNTPRTTAPSINTDNGSDGFVIKVATQNVLNYFNSPFGGSDNKFGDNRGAKSSLEFERQQAKIVEAIYGLNADIVGLMEVENNGFGDFGAIKTLLAAINAKYDYEDYGDRNHARSIHNRYVFVGFDKNGDQVLDELDTIGSDAITTGLIYRPSKVSLQFGKVIPMPEQHAPMIEYPEGGAIVDEDGEIRESGANFQRNTIAATFSVLNTGKKLTVAINHLKSKGSTCYEDWAGWQNWANFNPVTDDVRDDDYQGACENFRVAAAVHLGEEMAKLPGDKVLLGDMNSYAHEDPMLVLTNNPTGKALYAAGYTYIDGQPQYGPEGARVTKTYGYLNAVDLFTEEGETSWSYSYNNEIGSLDHLLVSPSMKDRLVDAKDWHINAPESNLYDYGNYKKEPSEQSNPFYAQTPFRSSDHDPALLVIGYTYGEAGENPVTVAVKSGRADIAFPVSAKAKKGDVAEIAISPRPAGVALPKVTLSNDGAQTVMFDVVGLNAGEYTFTMTLKRDAVEKSAAQETVESKALEMSVVKRDSSNVKPVYPENDGSGGSFGFGALLSLLGLGLLRRRR
ncbi:nuclease [Vibrio navarrensis]|uniref:ExeM/NucH family extracellular endonuclease n=1 Tax=Vibrio navarrensis TaxID=29495 RepID=UPI00052C9AC2|nr:ExeM/NucH family extracellular endonuclease [Vibrio navarrensis]KGK23013.1 nuclease [Vibrio navarrensis]